MDTDKENPEPVTPVEDDDEEEYVPGPAEIKDDEDGLVPNGGDH